MKLRVRLLVAVALVMHWNSSAENPPACVPLLEWQRSLGGTGSDNLRALIQTRHGGFLLAGESWSDADGSKISPSLGGQDIWLVRLDAQGNKVWDRAFGGSAIDDFVALQEARAGGFILAGRSGDEPGQSLWILRLDEEGRRQAEIRVPAASGSPNLLRETLDGGFILGGLSLDRFFHAEYWIARLNPTGTLIWERTFGGDDDDVLTDVQETFDGGFVLAGWSFSDYSETSGNKTSAWFGESDAWVIRLDPDGNKIWENSYGGIGFDSVACLLLALDSGFLLGGSSISPQDENKTSADLGNGDIWLVRLDAEGRKLWERTYGGSESDSLTCLKWTQDGGLLIAGSSDSVDGDKTAPAFGEGDLWLLRLDPDGRRKWDASYGGSRFDYIVTAEQSLEGKFIIGASSASPADGSKIVPSHGSWDYWVIRTGPDPICDSDGDGVRDDLDLCPETALGAIVNGSGCSIEQLALCDGPWRNHGEYVRAVTETAADFAEAGLITARQRRAIVNRAGLSACGR